LHRRVAPSSFHSVAGQRATVARHGGVRVVYRVSETGTAHFTVERLQRRANAAGVRRITLAGSFRHGALRGRSTLRFTGHLRGGALAPGRDDLCSG
jgi:hypothetical protein